VTSLRRLGFAEAASPSPTPVSPLLPALRSLAEPSGGDVWVMVVLIYVMLNIVVYVTNLIKFVYIHL
jgi:hypothetical protein